MLPSRRQILVDSYKLLDLTIMVGAFAGATWLTTLYSTRPPFRDLLEVRFKVGNFVLFLGLVIVWHLILKSLGLYRSRRLSPGLGELRDVFLATSLAALATLNVGILLHIQLITPGLVAMFWAASTSVVMVSRLLVRFALVRLRRQGRNLRNVLIVGTNVRARDFGRKIESSPEFGYNVLGYVDEEWSGMSDFRESGGKLVAGFDNFEEFLRSNVVDEVVIGLPLGSSYERCSRLVGWCEQQGITIRFLSDIFNLSLARATVEKFQGEPVITLLTGKISGLPVIEKRLLDVAVSAASLVVLAPLFLAVALAIKLTSRGPIFFAQQRLGLNKRRFQLYKFRTMVADAENRLAEIEHLNEVSGPVFKIANDPRVTRIGKLLRRTSCDELPQLLNVLKGDMSLVGPRPLPVRDYEGFDQDWHRRRFSVRPGLTCLWQINGRSSVSFERWMELDLEYIDNWSLWLDFEILFRTIPAVFRGTGAA